MQYSLGPPPMNPLSRLLAGLVAVLALAGALFFGIFILALVVGVGLIAWVVLWLRMWWIRRKLPRGGRDQDHTVRAGSGAAGDSTEREGEVIDAEYEVVSRDDHD